MLAQLRPGQHPSLPEQCPPSTTPRVRVTSEPGRQRVRERKPTAPAKDSREHRTTQRTLRDIWPQCSSVTLQSTLPVCAEVQSDARNCHQSPAVDVTEYPRNGDPVADQSPLMTETSRRTPRRFRLAPIPAPRVVPDLHPWVPGTQGLYPKWAPVASPGDRDPQFPVWNVRVEGMRRQQAMFCMADEIEARTHEHSVFYIAADVWAKDKSGWSAVKMYGAFRDPTLLCKF